jgi:predicted metal-binding membrane protein
MTTLAPPRDEVAVSSLRSLEPVRTAALILGAALVAWAVLVDRMGRMDAGPGTDLGGLASYLVIWVTMMAAMMLPSVAPMALLFARISRDRRREGRAFVPTWIFLAGYLFAWMAYGLGAYGALRVVTAAGTGWLAWDRAGPYVAGIAVAAAGLYQLSPLKELCLRHCRGPLHYVLHGWRPGRLGALQMGAEHGVHCVGCCWGLMVILFAVGVMSLFWMVVVAAAIFAEKVLPQGLRISRALALASVALGLWIAVAPSSVPGLTDPGGAGAPSMKMSP